MSGFCERCRGWLSDREATAHDTPDLCIRYLRGFADMLLERAEREHRWVHELEDVIAGLKAEKEET